MKSDRTKSSKRCFVSFSNETEWLEFELHFNVGRKHKLPVKFQAHQTWRSATAPALFSGLRADFKSIDAAEMYFAEQLANDGGVVHVPTSQLLARLRREHAYGA